MTANRHLLIVSHAPSDTTRALTQAVVSGASHPEIEAVDVRLVAPLEAGPGDVLWADAVILGTTANFGYMSGALKDFFDRTYYPCLELTQGLPYALFVRGKHDATGARDSVLRIVKGLKWRAVQAPLLMVGDLRPESVEQCEELGMAVAAALDAGML